MRKRIEVRSQAEFDACIEAGNVAIVIGCSVVARGNSSVVAWGNSSVVAWENSSVEAWENSSVVAWGNSSVVAWGNSSVEVWENSSVVARENSSVVARGNSSVVAWGNSSVVAWGNSSVVAWGNSSVVAWENSSVVARENSSVEARGNVFLRLFSAIKIRATAYVNISMHGNCGDIEGGRRHETAPPPTTGADWCDYFGINAYECAFKVDSIDQKILNAINNEKIRLDMSSWHGDEGCNESNWCNTTHCRAGAAVCLAGTPGWELEKKYGAETAGKMIYAVSRLGEPLPDFHASDEDALKDIRNHAGATPPNGGE